MNITVTVIGVLVGMVLVQALIITALLLRSRARIERDLRALREDDKKQAKINV